MLKKTAMKVINIAQHKNQASLQQLKHKFEQNKRHKETLKEIISDDEADIVSVFISVAI